MGAHITKCRGYHSGGRDLGQIAMFFEGTSLGLYISWLMGTTGHLLFFRLATKQNHYEFT